MENYLNGTGEVSEMIYVANELEKYAHLGVLAAITEELYFAKNVE